MNATLELDLRPAVASAKAHPDVFARICRELTVEELTAFEPGAIPAEYEPVASTFLRCLDNGRLVS